MTDYKIQHKIVYNFIYNTQNNAIQYSVNAVT